jgi:hypothetical protein
MSGRGGGSYFGSGGDFAITFVAASGTTAGDSATPFGAGGSGGLVTGNSTVAGGAGKSGVIIITEYK